MGSDQTTPEFCEFFCSAPKRLLSLRGPSQPSQPRLRFRRPTILTSSSAGSFSAALSTLTARAIKPTPVARASTSPAFRGVRPITLSSGRFGPYTNWLSILHSDAYKMAQISQAVVPAFFKPGDIDREIQRLSQYFGQEARILNAEPRPGAPHATLAVWGAVTLNPLGDATLGALRRGEQIHSGLLADFVGDARKSARLGLPVYSLGGGAGYLWGADFDDSGKGSLRITAVDASALEQRPVPVPDTTARAVVPTDPLPAPTPDPALAPQEQARRDAEKKARLDKIVPVAQGLIEDAKATLIKVDPKNPKLLDYVEQIGALNNAIGQNDPDEIERKSAALSTQLSREPVFQKLEADRAEKQKQAAARYLGDAIRLAQKQKRFMLDFVSQNPTSPYALKFVPLIKQIDPALVSPELTRVQSLTETIALTIREANLQDAFASNPLPASVDDLSKQAGTTPSPVIPVTEKNGFLVEGDLADVVLLYNANPDAPHVARNLRGDFVFSEDRADVCMFGSNPAGTALTVKTELLSFHARTVTGLSQSCDPLRLAVYDIVAAQRGAFLRSNLADALSLTKSIETGEFGNFTTITALAQRTATEAEHRKVDEITSDIARGSRSGFGLILLKSGSPNVCMIVGDKTEALTHLLLSAADKLGVDIGANPTILRSTAEEAFAGIRKGQCGAAYAAAADLKTLSELLRRENIPFGFSSTWMTPSEIDAADASLAESRRVVE